MKISTPSPLVAVLALCCCSVLPLAAQDQPTPTADSTLSVQIRLVGITALVRDKNGELVHDLNKDDFVLREDGKTVPVRYFNRDSDLPLTVGLMVDTSGSLKQYIDEEQKASATFLETVMTRPQDRAFLVRFDSHVLLLQKTTSDVTKLQTSLGLLTMPDTPPADPHAKKKKEELSLRPQRSTLLMDAIYAAAKQVIEKEPGRRALIVMTDGDDRGSATTLDEAIHEAQLADVAVYSVLYLAMGAGPGTALSGDIALGHTLGVSGQAVMQRISQATGGRAFVVTKGMPIAQIYAKIEEDLRSQYRLGYTPGPSKPNTFHTLELKTTDKHQSVQARTGYYTPQ